MMVNIPRENEFEADMVLYWQGRARKAQRQLLAISELPNQWKIEAQDERVGFQLWVDQMADELQTILNRSKHEQ